jgi:hypothetical protein
MQPSRTLRCLVTIASFFALAQLASAQIVFDEDYHGHRIGCALSGLRGAYSFCAADAERNYAYVFVGSIVSIADVTVDKNHEFRLRLHPEELFLGNASEELTVTTRAGECIDHDDPLQVGDRWLFYVNRDEQTKEPVVWFGGGSGPSNKSASEIALLRLQLQNPQSGLILGKVTKPEFGEEDGIPYSDYGPVVPNHKIAVTRKKDGQQLFANSDTDGNFIFPPLTPGEYEFNPNTNKTLWAEPFDINVGPRTCARVDVQLAFDGEISGHVYDASGKPVANSEVEVDHGIEALGTGTSFTKEDGSYEIRGLQPGRYLVGIGILDTQPPPSYTVYYPGFPDAGHAVSITLGDAEHRNGIDIHLAK